MLEKLFKTPGHEAELLQLARIAGSLERLVQLYELQLQAAGITTQGEEGEGEVLESDPDIFEAAEREEERIRLSGLAPGRSYSPVQPDGAPWPADFAGGGSWGFPVGPEGAEAAGTPAEEDRRD